MRPTRCFVLSLALILCAAAHADSIFNNLGTINSARAIEGSSAFNGYLGAAAAFTPSANYELTEVDLDITADGSNPTFNVSLYSDNGNLPGTLVATLATDLTAPAYVPNVTGATDITGLSVDILAGEQYWIAVTPYAAGSDTSWAFGHGASNVLNAVSKGSSWSASSSLKMQFAVEGTPIAATPEPSSVALLGTGLLGTMGLIRRRARCV